MCSLFWIAGTQRNETLDPTCLAQADEKRIRTHFLRPHSSDFSENWNDLIYLDANQPFFQIYYIDKNNRKLQECSEAIWLPNNI